MARPIVRSTNGGSSKAYAESAVEHAAHFAKGRMSEKAEEKAEPAKSPKAEKAEERAEKSGGMKMAGGMKSMC